MNPNDFKIVFASEKHEVDIETLIGCLMHTSNIIQEVNRILGTEKKIEVKIKALEQGSFEIHIELIEKLLDSIFSKDNINISAEIISVVAGLYGFVKWLKSKIKKAEKVDDGVEVTLENGDKTTININVYNTFNESKIARESIAKQISALDKNKDISGFRFESNETNVYISDEEFSSVVKTISSLNSEAKEPIKDILEDRKILIIRPSFDKDLKWDFVFDGQKISAKMNDEAMIKVIDNGEQFAKGDYMLVDIEVTKFYDNDLGVHLITKDSYKILRYKEHIKIEQVGKLF